MIIDALKYNKTRRKLKCAHKEDIEAIGHVMEEI